MNQNKLTTLSDNELLEEQKKLNSNTTANNVLIGLFVGIAIYSTFNKGFGFFTIFPLFFAFILFNKNKKIKAIENEIQARKLR